MDTAPANATSIRERYPWPAAWRGNTTRLGRGFLTLTLISVSLIAMGVLLIPHTILGWVTTFVGLAAASAGLAVYRYSKSDLRASLRGVTIDNRELHINSDRRSKFLLQLGTSAALVAAVFSFISPITEDFGDDRWDRQFVVIALVIGPIVIIWMTARLLSRPLFRQGKKMGIALSEYGVHHTSWWGESRYQWSYIDKIRIHRGITRSAFTHRPKEGNHLVITLDLTADGKSQIKGGVLSSPVSDWGPVMRNLTTINAAALDVYPPVVARVLTFYFEHPELRGELGTEKALERVRTGNFVA